MKITICGSIAHIEEMVAAKEALEAEGHEVRMPPLEIEDDKGNRMPVLEYHARRHAAAAGDSQDNTWIWARKKQAIQDHFDKIAWSDIVVVLNYPKKGIDGYVGGNTLMEMGVAFHLGKPLYLLFPPPGPEVSYREEILGMMPTVLHGELSAIL